MAVAATLEQAPTVLARFEQPLVLVVPEMDTDVETRLRASRFIGAVTLGASVEVEACGVEKPIDSLFDAIPRAVEGDHNALNLIGMSVRTDVVERTLKTGHVMDKVRLQTTAEGKVLQNGQTTDSIQANSLRYAADHPVMRARTEAETRNGFRTEYLYQQNYFEDYSLLVASRAERLPVFFTETMSCSLQLTTKDDTGLAIESAFVSGIAEAGAPQHDIETIVKLGKLFGVDFEGKTAAEIIDIPILIHNSLIPNGVIDIVKLYDICAGGTFFGENRPQQDYLVYLEYCHQREASFAPKVTQITKELLCAADVLKGPVDAVLLLHDLSELHMVEHAIADSSIDARVFGNTAAGYIVEARYALAQGDMLRVETFKRKAENTASSNSCPSSIKTKGEGFDSDLDAEDGSSSNSAEDDGDCDFVSRECPECKKKDVKTKVQKLTSSGKKRISGSCGCVKIVN